MPTYQCKHTHSSWSSLRMAGILVAEGGLGLASGFTEWVQIKAVQKALVLIINNSPFINVPLSLLVWTGESLYWIPPSILSKPLISSSCSSARGSPVMGSVPFSRRYFVTRRRSNTWLETGESTGSSGTSLQTAREAFVALLSCSHYSNCKTTK